MAAWVGFRPLEDGGKKEWCSWEYDSTWESDEGEEKALEEEEEEGKRPRVAREEEEEEEEEKSSRRMRDSPQASGAQERRRPAVASMGYRGFEFSPGRNWTAAKDMQRYRHHYPGLEEKEIDAEEEEMWNLSFYKNEISFLPNGLYIDHLLEEWQDNYEILEENHSYIQWLFPLRERGVNWRAKPLTCKEIQAFKKSEEVMQRFIRAYKLMLGFYGINLINEETGEVGRAENWMQRFRNLDRFSHNNLRITRILKCLGEMGYEHYQVHLVKFFLSETLVYQTLPNVKRSALDYFLFTIRSKQKRRELIYYAWNHFRPQNKFVWGPLKKLLNYKPPLSKSQHCQKTPDKQESIRDKEAVGKKKNNPPNMEEKVGDAADLQTEKVTNEHASEEQSQCGAMYVAERGDSIEEKQVSFLQLAEEVLSEDAVGRGSGAECEYLKESKKRKLELHRLSGKCTEQLKSSIDIEKISHNLGECAINQEITKTLPSLPETDNQVVTEECDLSSEDLKVTESSDAPVKRRKVDEAMPENSALIVELNLDTDAVTCNVHAAEPDAADCGAEKEVHEEDRVVQETNVETENGADGATVNSLSGSETTEAGLPSPAGSDSVQCEANAEIANEEHEGNETPPASDSQADISEEKGGAEDVNARGDTKALGKNQSQERLQQSMVASGPEKAIAKDIAQEINGFEDSAELNGLQAMAESGGNIGIAPEQGKEGGR
uniref:Opioid growth factor receptor n=1 Tax=Pelusios castaneus TaxID=367368 RepID=A0A8C8VEY9_9SAUR